MRLINLATSRWAPVILQSTCRLLPARICYWIGDALTAIALRQKAFAITRALRTNMSVIQGIPEDDPRIDLLLKDLFRNLVRGYVDFFKAVGKGPEALYAACKFDPDLLEIITACRKKGQGLMLVGTHNCSFDLLLLSLRSYFPEVQALTLSNPQGSSVFMNEIRAQFGISVTPISRRSLRSAITRLRNGGVVAIAADIPLENGDELVFFGRKTKLPTGYVRLAMKSDSKIVVGTSQRMGPGAYRTKATLVPKPRCGNKGDQGGIRWAQKIMTILENYIRERPSEWFMPTALWVDEVGCQTGAI